MKALIFGCAILFILLGIAIAELIRSGSKHEKEQEEACKKLRKLAKEVEELEFAKKSRMESYWAGFSHARKFNELGEKGLCEMLKQKDQEIACLKRELSEEQDL